MGSLAGLCLTFITHSNPVRLTRAANGNDIGGKGEHDEGSWLISEILV